MGDERVTVQNLQVMQVREAEKIILISGAVPGANGSYVIVRPAIKHPERVVALHAEHRKHEEEEKAKKPKTLAEMARENERESFNQSSSQGSEDRVDRRRPRHAGRA